MTIAHVLLVAVILVPLLGLSVYLRPLKPGIVRAQLTYSEASFREVLARWSPEALRRFRAHFVADYAFILVYAAAGWAWWQATPPTHPLGQLLPWLLPGAALCDVSENLLHQQFLRSAPGSLPSVVFAAAGLAASFKFALWLTFILAAAFGARIAA